MPSVVTSSLDGGIMIIHKIIEEIVSFLIALFSFTVQISAMSVNVFKAGKRSG